VWGPNRPAYYGRAIEAQRVTGLEVENFKGSAAHPHKSVAIQVTPPDALCIVGK
jgi:hypothetical protein